MSIFFGFINPLRKVIMAPATDPDLKPHASRAWFAYLMVVLAATYGLIGWQAPQTMTLPALALPAPEAEIRSPVAGTVRFRHPAGQRVTADQVLVEIEPFELLELAQRLTLEQRRAQLDIELAGQDLQALEQAEILNDLIQERLTLIQRQVQQSQVLAGRNGEYLVPAQGLIIGQRVERGQTLGQVFDGQGMQIQALMPEDSAARLSEVAGVIGWSVADQTELQLRVVGRSPAGSRIIDQPGFTLDGGGTIATQQDDQGRAQAVQAYIKLWLETDQVLRPYERLWIRFQLPDEPLAFRLYRATRRNFLTWFGR